MANHYGTLPIVSDGLVFCVDAKDKHSYPGSGTVITDLTNNISGDFINEPTFYSDGFISFDGSNDHLKFSSFNPDCWGTTFWTVEVWFRTDSTINDGSFGCLFGNGNPFQMYQVANDKIQTYLVNGGFFVNAQTNNTAALDDVWNHYCMTRTDDGLGNSNSSTYVHYLNGAADGTFTSNSSVCRTSDEQGLHMGNVWSTNTNFCYGGDIGPARIYDRSLTATEVSQNFNAQRGRFGV